ncbi:MAG TPA: molybdopterin cofactor-binding domain-containing protein [Acetobacteraceae bacterium]|nr:molybdopterin cofactor-binding domain-containing protein [Acetobacteraceae bacterium]
MGNISRRSLLASGGALVVAFTGQLPAAAQVTARTGPAPDELDSWLAIQQDGSVIAFFGKMDPGQGVDVAIRQIVADEIDVQVERVSIVMGDTARTVNQGGASGSTGVERGGITLRYAGAEARRVLLDLASERLGVAADALHVRDGVISVIAEPARQVSYAELIGNRHFDVPMQWNGIYGNRLVARGRAEPKRPGDYRVVGTSVPRTDIAENVFARHRFVTDIRLPGMLHARMIRPAVTGSVPTAVDEASVADIPGVHVVWKQGFLGVAAPREWDAIRAAGKLKVIWSQVTPPFPGNAALYDHMRAAKPIARHEPLKQGDADAAIAAAARVVEAEYEWPFQSHASMGPACAVVDAGSEAATLWTGTQKPHFAAAGVARILGLKRAQVRAIWVRGAGSYGRNDAGDAAMDAAVMSQALGAPVRVQYMRAEGTGWDPKGPASIHRARAGLDSDGKVVGYRFDSRGFSRTDINTTESDPAHSLAGQSMGMKLTPTQAFGIPTEPYQFPAQLRAWETIPALFDRASPLRSSHLRDPVGPQLGFASESFIDELAHAVGADAVAFRLKHLRDPRAIAAIRACADRFGWEPRIAASSRTPAAVATGRGFAYAQRGQTIVALAVEVEVNRTTGRVWPRRWTVAHDCGLVINPQGLRLCIEGNIVQGTSRALWEEVTFDPAMVTSLDWLGYPILDLTDVPGAIDIVLLDRPDLPPSGAGEGSIRPVAAAIGNAIFDATGVRQRRAPFTPERIKAAIG